MERELGSKQAKAGSKAGMNGDAGRKAGYVGQLKTLLPPVFVEAFALTFLAEWGDRSQVRESKSMFGMGCGLHATSGWRMNLLRNQSRHLGIQH